MTSGQWFAAVLAAAIQSAILMGTGYLCGELVTRQEEQKIIDQLGNDVAQDDDQLTEALTQLRIARCGDKPDGIPPMVVCKGYRP